VKAAKKNEKKGGAGGKKGKKDDYSDEEIDYEETSFSLKSHKDFKKPTAAKKPAAPPSKPVFGAGKT